MAELDVETARWLTSTTGCGAVATATRQLDEGADELAVSAGLRRLRMPIEQRNAVLEAATARRRARERWPAADELLLTRQALEQASDPAVAAHRAGRLWGELADGSAAVAAIVDLCAGIGGDTIALARAAAGSGLPVLAVDTDAARLQLLRHNAEVVGVAVATRQADALTVDLPEGSVLHADPSRRRDGRRVRRLSEHVPSVPALFAAHPRALSWAVALAPGVDVGDPDLPRDVEVEYVQLGRALVEATVWVRGEGDRGHRGRPSDRSADEQRRARATVLAEDGPAATRVGVPAHRARLPVGVVGCVLIEVVPAAVRARLHDAIGGEVGARRVADHRALLTADVAPPASPWYRAHRVLEELPARPQAVRRWLRGYERTTGRTPTVEIVLHGVTADPEELWRDLGRPQRGPQGLRLEFVRRDHDSVVIVTDGAPPTAATGSGEAARPKDRTGMEDPAGLTDRAGPDDSSRPDRAPPLGATHSPTGQADNDAAPGR